MKLQTLGFSVICSAAFLGGCGKKHDNDPSLNATLGLAESDCGQHLWTRSYELVEKPAAIKLKSGDSQDSFFRLQGGSNSPNSSEPSLSSLNGRCKDLAEALTLGKFKWTSSTPLLQPDRKTVVAEQGDEIHQDIMLVISNEDPLPSSLDSLSSDELAGKKSRSIQNLSSFLNMTLTGVQPKKGISISSIQMDLKCNKPFEQVFAFESSSGPGLCRSNGAAQECLTSTLGLTGDACVLKAQASTLYGSTGIKYVADLGGLLSRREVNGIISFEWAVSSVAIREPKDGN